MYSLTKRLQYQCLYNCGITDLSIHRNCNATISVGKFPCSNLKNISLLCRKICFLCNINITELRFYCNRSFIFRNIKFISVERKRSISDEINEMLLLGWLLFEMFTLF